MDIRYEITRTIWASHRDICRFSDEEDAGYKRLVKVISDFVAEVAEAQGARRARVREEGGEEEGQVDDSRNRVRVDASLMDAIDIDAEGADIVD